ncbi:MAG: hypothetical protein GC199_01180 [Alphaproteobacteria bacterium]|nr:hypothetical protein [Alphaproteobacteria bacterium]
MTMNRLPMVDSRTTFWAFETRLAFHYGAKRSGSVGASAADGSPYYLARHPDLIEQVLDLADAKRARIIESKRRLAVCAPEAWPAIDFSRQRVLFLSLGAALGDCVGVYLFFQKIFARTPSAAIGLATKGHELDIFSLDDRIQLHPFIVSARQLQTYDIVVDLALMPGWTTVAQSPVDAESVLSAAFAMAADAEPPPPTKAIGRSPTITVMPMASSALRSLPPRVVTAIAGRLSRGGYPLRFLWNGQWQQADVQVLRKAIDPSLEAGVDIRPGFRTTLDLLRFVAEQDYVVVADSGPAHLTKLFGIPGTAIYTSADGSLLQGRHRNLSRWQTSYAGPHCSAPCGLAVPHLAPDGKIGCMGSLGIARERLTPSGMNKVSRFALAQTLLIDNPVPCVKALADQAEDVAAFVLADIEARLKDPNARSQNRPD